MSNIYTGSMHWGSYGSKFCWFRNPYKRFVQRSLPPAYIFWLWCPRNIEEACNGGGVCRNGEEWQ